MKNVELMSDHELLMELVEAKRREDTRRTIRIVLCVLAAVVIGVALWNVYQKLAAVMEQFNRMSTEIDSLKEKATEVFGVFNSDDVNVFKKLSEELQNILKIFNRG